MITLAPARPRDADALAQLVYATGPYVFDYLYAREPELLRFLAHQLAHERGVFGLRHATAAYDGDRLVGVELGFDRASRDDDFPETGRLLREILRPEQFRHLVAASRQLERLFPPLVDGVYYVQNLSVVPDVRGHRVGEILLANAFERAARAGYGSVQLDVSMTNRARRFYDRQGMELLEEIRDADLERESGIPGQHRMIKRLHADAT